MILSDPDGDRKTRDIIPFKMYACIAVRKRDWESFVFAELSHHMTVREIEREVLLFFAMFCSSSNNKKFQFPCE